MNAHIPQSYEAMVELEDIAAIPHHIITPRHAKPMIGVYQDTLVGSYRLTQKNVQFTRREFMNLMMWNKRFNGVLPVPRLLQDGKERCTGQQVLGAIMPPINIEMGNKSFDSDKDSKDSDSYVRIKQGDIQQGVVDSDVYMKPSKGIIHVTYNDCGPKETVDLLDALQNTVENFLVLNGFSVGISDLVADEETKQEIDAKIQERKKQVEQVILQVHMDLFDNNTGKTNQQEFEDQVFGILNKATSDAGATSQKSLSSENRLVAMVRSGSKGEPLNIAQMMACLGQTAIEGKRVPYGFTDRTLPHYKKYDDSAEARGFIESSFIRGLTPQEFFFHAMSGREGLIDTAVKSVTGNTEIVIIENGQTKHVTIGDWIDSHLVIHEDSIQHMDKNNMEYLELDHSVFIPTVDADGNVSWGEVKAVTRHDPGKQLYQIKTLGGREVTVTEAQSLLIWNAQEKQFLPKLTPDVTTDDYVPVTMHLPVSPVIIDRIEVSTYLPKSKYLYGSDFERAVHEMNREMKDRERIPARWWQSNNGSTFTLPYDSKARLQRATVRSNVSNIKSGYVYPFTTNRDHALIPDTLPLDNKNGIMIGLYLAEGNADIKSGYIQITNNDNVIRTFVKSWFDSMNVKYSEEIKVNHIGGTSSSVRGYSTILAQLFTDLMGHGAENKHVPSEAYSAPEEFVTGVLNGYFSGDGTVSSNSIEAGSASERLIQGMSMLCNRIGLFGKVYTTTIKKNNIGTSIILPTYRISIRAQWATLFAKKVSLIDDHKQVKLMSLNASEQHRNFVSVKDVVMDKIIEINPISADKYPKMYDLTIPSTFNFGLANGLQVRDTADTGYIQRQLIKSMEDLTVQHDGTVRDANNNIVQFHYGEDGINPTKIETQSLPIGKLSQSEIRDQFGMVGVDWSTVLKEGSIRENDELLITQYLTDLEYDQRMMVEGVFQRKSLDSGSVFAPVNLARWILNTKIRFGIKSEEKTDLTPAYVLEGIKKLMTNTHDYHKIWCALLRFHLAPHKLIVKERFTKDAFDMLMELILVNHMKAWVQPGDQVGIVAAQSIGEPATQMSSVGSTVICITNGKDLRFYGTIQEFVDPLLVQNKEKVMQIAKDSCVMPLEDDYYIIGVSEDEKTSWKRISEISRHPANGGLVEVVTRTGRSTTATLTHSFLTRSKTGVVPILGSDLRIGTRIPVAKYIPEVPGALTEFKQGDTTFIMDKEFGWVCGIYLADGSLNGNTTNICKIHSVVEETLKLFTSKYNMELSTRHYQGEYGPSKNNRIESKDLKDFLYHTFKTGSYEKEIGGLVFHANKEFIAGLISGFFDGDGNVSVERQQIRASSRSKKLIDQVCALLGYCGMFGSVLEETSKRIKDKVQHTLNIPRKFSKQYKETVGFLLKEKADALDKIIEYNEREDVHSQQEMIDKIPELGSTIAETGKLLKMPGQSRTYGRWAKKESIGRRTLEQYVSDFEEMMAVHVDKEVEEKIKENMALLQSALNADVFWDEIVDLIYYDDPKEYVYDFTVPGNDSFMVDNNILVHNTLNSVDWDTEIYIAKNGKLMTPKIGEFIDMYYDECKDSDRVKLLPNNQIYIELKDGNDWQAVSCGEDGIMKWTKLEAITRHPVINDDGTDTILKVTLESGREVKATKGKSFLTLQNGKILGANGSELKMGDALPIANHLAIEQLGYITKVSVREILPPQEYMYGTEVKKAKDVMDTSKDRHWFTQHQGTLFTVPYSRSDAFRDAFQHGRNSNDIRVGNVYTKHMKKDVSQIPETIELTSEFGFFCGAYLAEGMSNDTQVIITNNDMDYLTKVKIFMDEWNVGTHIVSEERVIENTKIKGTTTSLIIHSTILAKIMKTWFGRISYEKNIPTWVLQAPDEYLKGLIDGYISGDGTVDKRAGTVHATSVSYKLLESIQSILARYHIYSKVSCHMPKIHRFQSVHKAYTMTVPTKYSNIFSKVFTLSMKSKQERLVDHHHHREAEDVASKWNVTKDMVWDKIKHIEEVKPMGEGWMYDLTVEETTNFTTKNLIAVKDTFHQAGVASKSAVTRGVPRLRELLKVTHNPKATSLTIYLRPEYRNNKEKAREVAQDLELTILRTITEKVAIYWDETDDNTVIEEDRELMKFYRLFESDFMAEQDMKHTYSKWLLRLELNHEEMFNRNISIQEVVRVMNAQFKDEINVVYSDYNSEKLVMRIRIPVTEAKDTASNLDDFTNLKKFQNKLLNSIVIRGLSGIKGATFRKDTQFVENVNGKYEPIEQYILDTDGSNFIRAMNHPAIDGTRLYSTNVWDVYEVLGIEATRSILFNEISGLFESVGVNYRHLCLLCDVMTRFGRLMSIDRYGIKKNDVGTLAKASFEETQNILLKAALYGEVDPVTGVSANIMMGQPIRGGTAFSQILLDDQALPKLLADMDIDKYADVEEEQEGDLLADERLGLDDPCSSAQFQMNLAVPSMKRIMMEEEPDIEMEVMA